MRALMIPQIVSSGGPAEGNYYSMLCIRRALETLGPTFCYVWLGRHEAGRFRDGPGLWHVYEEALRLGFYPQMAAVDLGRLVDLFSWQIGVYPVDAVFCSRPAVAPLLSLALADMAGQYPVPVVITEPRVYGPGERGHNQVHPTQLALRAAGYATCFGLYWSGHEREMALAAAAQYCSAGVLKEMEERAFVVDALVDVDALVHEVNRPAAPKRLLFAGRLNANKRWAEVVEAYGKVLMARTDVEVWVHAGTGAFEKIGGATTHRWHRTSERLSRPAYWTLLGSTHVAAYLSHDEGANVTVQEMLAAGIVVVLPRRPWVEHLFAPLVYPFQVGGPAELPPLLDWLLDHAAEAQAQLAPVRELIQRERAWPAFCGKFRRLADALQAVPRPPAYRAFRTVVEEELERRRGLPAPRLPFSSALGLTPAWRSAPPKISEVRGMRGCYEAVRDLDDCAAADPWLARPAAVAGTR